MIFSSNLKASILVTILSATFTTGTAVSDRVIESINDVVVEAVNTHDKTSAAGGKYENPVGTPIDTTFSNPNSYDIFTASNPPINDFKLSDPPKKVVSRYNTEQWITTDGSIKLWVKDNIPPDWDYVSALKKYAPFLPPKCSNGLCKDPCALGKIK